MAAPMESLQALSALAEESPCNAAVRAWKEKGGEVIGYLCTYVPEELLYAAGLLPVRMSGCSEEMTGADAYLYANTCFFARSCLQTALDGGYDFLDGLVASNSCDAIRRLYDVFRLHRPFGFLQILDVPRKVSEEAVAFFREGIEQLKRGLEEMVGRGIGEEELREAIGLYNQGRQLLRQLYGLRRQDPPRLTGAEAMEVLRAGVTLPRPDFNRHLKQLLAELEGRPPLEAGRVRLMISGSMMDRPELLRSIEAVGAWVVTDDLCLGTRAFWNPVDPALDPLTGLAKRYLSHPPCARMRPYTRRLDHIREMVREFKVDGVIYETIKFCDIFGYERPLIKEDLLTEGIPVLELDLEYGGGGAVGQVRTRVEAFLEMLHQG